MTYIDRRTRYSCTSPFVKTKIISSDDDNQTISSNIAQQQYSTMHTQREFPDLATQTMRCHVNVSIILEGAKYGFMQYFQKHIWKVTDLSIRTAFTGDPICYCRKYSNPDIPSLCQCPNMWPRFPDSYHFRYPKKLKNITMFTEKVWFAQSKRTKKG